MSFRYINFLTFEALFRPSSEKDCSNSTCLMWQREYQLLFIADSDNTLVNFHLKRPVESKNNRIYGTKKLVTEHV